MKLLYSSCLFFLVNCLPNFLTAQTYSQAWSVCQETNNVLVNTLFSKTDKNGNTYVAGNEQSIFEPNYKTHYFLQKFNANGTLGWKKYFNAAKDSIDNVKDLVLDPAGNIYITATRIDSFCNICTESIRISDIVTTKYNPAGKLLWRNRLSFGEYKVASPEDIVVAPNGTCLVTANYTVYNPVNFLRENTLVVQVISPNGNTLYVTEQPGFKGYSGAIDYQHGNVYVAGSNQLVFPEQPALSRYNKQGNLLWTKTFNENFRTGSFYHVFTDMFGDIYTNGMTNSNSFFSQPYIVTVKYNRAGQTVWAKNEGVKTYSRKNIEGDFLVDKKGNVYLTGAKEISANDDDWITVKYDLNGNKKWSRQYTDPAIYNNYPSSLSLTNSGDLLVAGNGSLIPFQYAYNTVVYDDTSGLLRWQAYYQDQPAGNAIARGAEMDMSGNIYTGGSNPCVIKYSPLTTHAVTSDVKHTLSSYPNPAVDFISIVGLDHTRTLHAEILNKEGVKMMNIQIPQSRQIDVKSLPSGMYFIKFLSDRDIQTISFLKE
jgi:hypothetical protein